MYEEYTLEMHLKEVCKDRAQYSHLSASLELDKIEIRKILAEIVYNTPHYSDHEISHSESILQKIEMLLGIDRIKQLQPTETWLIIMAAYTHDLGMIIFNDKLLENWKDNDFQSYLKESSENAWDKDLKDACSLILGMDKDYIKKNLSWPLNIKNAVNIIVSDYFRKKHADGSRKMLLSSGLDDHQDLFLTSSINVNRRIIRLLAEVALSHSYKFEKVMDNFPYESNGCGTDKVHPRFVSSLLRLGDLLDLDNNRFNKYNEKLMGKLPKVSNIHKEKHEAITHFLVTSYKIEVSADCPNTKVYRELRRWLDMLEGEVKDLSINWNIVAPSNFGTPPKVENIQLKIRGKDDFINQANLKFEIDAEKAFEVIEGSGIYDNNLIFIRELIQNAIDATKIQMWKDIKDGLYSGILGRVTIEDIRKSPHSLDERILKNYPITIKLDIEEMIDDDYNFIFKISDKGAGINNNDLMRICKVGSSYKTDKKLIEIIDDIPFYLKPTAAFGLGLQSCFLSTDKIEIHTKVEGENVKKIEMESGKQNGYITVEDSDLTIKKGSFFLIRVNRKEVEKISLERVRYDEFSDENIYFRFLNDYIINLVKDINLFYFELFFDCKKFKIEYKNPFIKTVLNGELDYSNDFYIAEKECGIKFYVIEREIGAFVTFKAHTEESKSDRVKIRVRGIEIKEASYLKSLDYLQIEINILSEKSDQLLNMSRDKPRDEKEFYRLISRILKNSLEILFDNVSKNTKNRKFKSKISDTLKFALEYERKVYFKDNNIKTFNNNSTMKIYEISKTGVKECSVSKLFKVNRVLITRGDFLLDENVLEKFRNENKNQLSLKSGSIIVAKRLFNSYIKTFFKSVDKIKENNNLYYIHKRKQLNTITKKDEYAYLINNLKYDFTFRRVDKNLYSYRFAMKRTKGENTFLNEITVKKSENNWVVYSPFYCTVRNVFCIIEIPKIAKWNSPLLQQKIPSFATS